MTDTVDSLNLWGNTLLNSMTALWTKVAGFIPNLLAFFVILLIGYALARLLGTLTRRLLVAIHIDDFSQRVGVRTVLDRASIRLDVSAMLSRLVFWLLMLTFLVSATETLGLPRVSATIDTFVQYLPKVLGAAFILLVGLFIAQFVRALIVGGAESLGIESAGGLGGAAYGLLVIIVVTLAIGQLELETEILNQVIAILLISLGGAAALAFGLGSREVAGNILAGTYARELYREGDRLVIG
ncbi:MAG: mechanosensitive ion channel family protein, partial [Pseudomonadales bacterium]|nr:mechanosensitive ion channel family protein [Pseudomonadales bacterium]